MKTLKPTLVKGTRDFNTLQIANRQYIADIIQNLYVRYGFAPLETPALENISTLSGQYGQEGDQLMFRVLNSGDFLAGVDPDDMHKGYKSLTAQIADKGLRYDLTVPLMRYVATHRHKLLFPFKRYQIQPVWRADRPQKGRYREFYQCDADVVGTPTLVSEAEILAMTYQLFAHLGIPDFVIQLNHRAILNGLMSHVADKVQAATFFTILDKFDKSGQAHVEAELLRAGFSAKALAQIQFIFNLPPTNAAKLATLQQHLQASEEGLRGLQELQKVLDYLSIMGLPSLPISLTPTLARGLSYYTGTIFEIKTAAVSMGSLGGGGRYDYIGTQGGASSITGVGLSIGLDRLCAAMDTLDMLPERGPAPIQVMLTNLDPASEVIGLRILTSLRAAGVRSEIYPVPSKLRQQMSYANKKRIPFVIIIGDTERAAHQLSVKEMRTGFQKQYTLHELINMLT